MQLRPIGIEKRLEQLPPRFRGGWKDRSGIDRNYESGRQCGAI
jgi:predicted ABC-type transport system involved in lysophospholipase L1 biosynthesis ATPase subunit